METTNFSLDLHLLNEESLLKYKRSYSLKERGNDTRIRKRELLMCVNDHLHASKVDEVETIAGFLYAVKHQKKMLKWVPRMSDKPTVIYIEFIFTNINATYEK
ncbi:hypothetical protein ROZALSC1DRAFT_27344 [Rozella allomycis CSF55]|uniref:Histone deacetylase complex subunit SAP30 Sin3 binding domain-containing protein n=1 Tax=Rozella allomycis (strain CSF55) TaxID=988480 RepID=A0A4P9YND6_ROZAC|nr:hypothetical protein ROZALSC1DRAFT_27344 [Rozella allomycis CSF55]